MSNLCFRQIPVEDICPLCNKVGEATLHTLWDCKIFKKVRKQWISYKASIREYKKCNARENISSLVRQGNVVWPHPSPGVFKVNCDASVDAKGGVLVLVWLSEIQQVLSWRSGSQVIVGNPNAQVAEVIAILRGIQFSKDCGFSPCMFESDAEVVIRWINDSSHLESVCACAFEVVDTVDAFEDDKAADLLEDCAFKGVEIVVGA
ncbi:hypothetical protein Dsin_009965 [Dipteronia sinensis]|uniref:RNase H type-1 domain-containing protein n=1 Tax=Dipteronia sinensis TaxID=43782 RepID=A0AAE0EDZ0_9ROSI|nr:hypothetical protein Dsin_009965 [Dipteronia sinensis]